VVVAGSFNEKKILSQIEKSFKNCSTEKGLTKLAVAEAQNEPQILKEERKIDQTHLVLGVRTFDAYNKQNAVLKVLSGVLGGGMSSRLFEKMRNELGICYYVRNTTDALSDHGFFSISAGVKNERLIEALSGIMGELELLKNELVSKKELDKVKEYLVAGMYLHLESSDSVADFYGSDEILNKKIKKPEELAKEIYKVTAKEINDLAKKIFVNKNLNLAIVGPQSDDTKIKEVLKFK
jgi:predicted Zn-dependent peptidase